MQQEISRKEFLRYVGIAFLSLFGVAAVLQNLSNTLGQPSKKVEKKESSGYGYSAYGR
jgi:arginine exporter protein ArgO